MNVVRINYQHYRRVRRKNREGATIAVDAARLPILLTELRLPTFARIWPSFAETADAESWPAVRFLAALAEHAVAERLHRRIARHAQESRLPPG